MSNNILIFLMFTLNFLFPFILSFIFISYVKNLEDKKCNCSNDIKRKYVKYYGYFFLTISVLSIIVPLLYIKYPILVNINDYLKLITLVVNLAAAYVLYEYSEYLENNDCKCSESWKKVFIKYYSYFLIFTMSVIFFCILMIFIAHILYQEDKYIYGVKNLLRNCKI